MLNEQALITQGLTLAVKAEYMGGISKWLRSAPKPQVLRGDGKVHKDTKCRKVKMQL